MNAYEKRQEVRKAKAKSRYLKLKDMKLHQLSMAERYYISAFTALNHQPPWILPNLSADQLVKCANQLFATAHAIELGGEDE